MKILFYQWHSFMNKGIEKALIKLNINYDILFYQQDNWEEDEKFEELLTKQIKNSNKVYDIVFSVNFAPIISKVCEEIGIKYVSWIYDSPIHIRNLESLKNSCNYIYVFDRGMVEKFVKMGINAIHMPLAVDTEIFMASVSAKKNCLRQDVSFVGSLYQTDYGRAVYCLNDYDKGYLEGIIAAQSKVNMAYIIPDLINQSYIDKINGIYEQKKFDLEMEKRELEYLLATEVTGRERYSTLQLLANHFDVKLYTGSDTSMLKDIHSSGYIDYYDDMPAVFANSRINLNISLCAICTGIPLRAVDIMGCGGFLMTRPSVEIYEYLAVGHECETYENLEDLYYKTQFYLKNDELRRKIAIAGLQKIQRAFKFEDRIKAMLKI